MMQDHSPSPAQILEAREAPPTLYHVHIDILRRFVAFVAIGPDTKKALALRVWAAIDAVSPAENPPDLRTPAAAAHAYSASLSHVYAIREAARLHFFPVKKPDTPPPPIVKIYDPVNFSDDCKKKASLSQNPTSAGSDVCPPFSHGNRGKARRARK